MDITQRGKLILKTVPTGEVEERVVRLLIKFAKTASAIELTEKVRNTPYVLSNDIEAEKALMFIEAIRKCGATAEFILDVAAKPAAEQSTPVPRRPAFSFESDTSIMDEALPPPIHVKPVDQRQQKQWLDTAIASCISLNRGLDKRCQKVVRAAKTKKGKSVAGSCQVRSR